MGRKRSVLDQVLGWCSGWGLGGIGFRKKQGFPLGLPRTTLWGVKEWSSRLALRLLRGPGYSRWGLLRIGDSWIASPNLSNSVCAQSVPLRPAHHLRVSGARMRRLVRNPRCRVERTSQIWIWIFGLCPPFIQQFTSFRQYWYWYGVHHLPIFILYHKWVRNFKFWVPKFILGLEFWVWNFDFVRRMNQGCAGRKLPLLLFLKPFPRWILYKIGSVCLPKRPAPRKEKKDSANIAKIVDCHFSVCYSHTCKGDKENRIGDTRGGRANAR